MSQNTFSGTSINQIESLYLRIKENMEKKEELI